METISLSLRKTIRVGSKNPVKVEAVKEYFPEFDVEGVDADSGIDEQPKSLREISRGARNRALCRGVSRFGENAGWGIGIESGIMPDLQLLPTELPSFGWMNVVICTIWDGKIWGTGTSSGFIVPEKVIDIAFRDNVDLSEAVFRAGLTKEKRIGYKEGIVHVLTGGKMDRKEYIKQAIMMAMIQMDHPELFGEWS